MKKRIDVLLFERGLAPSREKARTLMREHVAHDSDRVRDLLFKSTA
mgnify:CR=1 FL=1